VPRRSRHQSTGTMRRANSRVSRSSFSASWGDDDHAICEPFAAWVTFDLERGAAPCPLLPSAVDRRVRGVQEVGDPRDIAGQLDVTVDDLGVHVGVQHYRGPLTKQIVSVPGRADQRVPEPYPGADLGQARRGRRRSGVRGNPPRMIRTETDWLVMVLASGCG